MLEHLFGSKTRVKLLRTFFLESGKAFYVRELTRVLGVQINAVRRELELLVASGLVKEATREMAGKKAVSADPGAGLRKYYRLDAEAALYPEFQALLAKAQLLEKDVLTKELSEKAGGEIQLLILTGRFAGAREAPSDMLIVGAFDERAVARIIAKYEKEFGFEIRYTLMTESEFADRRHLLDKFVYRLFEGPHIKMINRLNV